MPGQPHSRSLPGRPSLRFLKLEAKRRIAAGEFPSLHEAQVAIAREHGLPSWAALKRQIGEDQDSPALSQLRWVISRFAGAGQAGEPGWTAPTSHELNRCSSAVCAPSIRWFIVAGSLTPRFGSIWCTVPTSVGRNPPASSAVRTTTVT